MPCFPTAGRYDSIATVAISAVPQCQQGWLWQIVQKNRYNGFIACVNVTLQHDFVAMPLERWNLLLYSLNLGGLCDLFE